MNVQNCKYIIFGSKSSLCVESSAVFAWFGDVFLMTFRPSKQLSRALEAILQNKLEHVFESLLNSCNKCI